MAKHSEIWRCLEALTDRVIALECAHRGLDRTQKLNDLRLELEKD